MLTLSAAYQDALRAVVRDTIEPNAAGIDKEAVWPEANMRALQEAGFGGLVVAKEAGGLGLGLEALTELCETIGRSCASTAISFGMHHVATAVLGAKATPEQAERYLHPIAAGEHLTTLALSEPGTGVHFYYPDSQLEANGDGFIVNGRKSFITNGAHADSYVVSTTAADPDAPPSLFSCVIVEREQEGLEWGEPYAGLGMRGNSARSLELTSVQIPSHQLIGQQGDQIWYVFHVVAPYFLVAMAGTYLGIAERAIHEATEHLKDRSYAHTGGALSDEPILQHRLGTLWARWKRTRALCYWAAREADQGGPEALPALCSAKAEVAECAVDTVSDVMTLMGGKTYRDSSLLPRLLRDARAAHVMAPTTDLLRTWTGRALLDIPLLAE